MILEILVVVAAILVGFIAFVASRPSDFVIVRSRVVPAPASALFDEVNDLHKWEGWSPWAGMDPHTVNTYEGPETGVGAIHRWQGNREVGAGAMTIVESRADQLVGIKLEFLKPFRATNIAEFTFEPQGSGTLVTWSMRGRNSFPAKVFGLFVDCDKMVGSMFEKGLANLQGVTSGVTQTRVQA